MYDMLNEDSKNILLKIQRNAFANNEHIVGSEYLLLEILKCSSIECTKILQQYKINTKNVLEVLDTMVIFRKNINGVISYTDEVKDVFLNAVDIIEVLEEDKVTPNHLLYSLLEQEFTIAKSILLELDVCIEEIKYEIINSMGWDALLDEHKQEQYQSTDNVTNLPFVTDLSKKAKNEELLPLIGRVKELERLEKILKRKIKNNALVIGSAGVGKTALVEGLAQRFITTKNKYKILQLNINSLIAGTKYRGDFEKRIDMFLRSIRNKKDVIIYIDEIHTIVGAGKGESSLDVANILKPELSRGNIRFIGSTTSEEYMQHIKDDSALSRRFETIFLHEPSKNETYSILMGIKEKFEHFHKIVIPSYIVRDIIDESKYLYPNRKFPDKAIDLLDDVCVEATYNNHYIIARKDLHDTLNKSRIFEPSKFKTFTYSELNKYYLKHSLGIRNNNRNLLNVICKSNGNNEEECVIKEMVDGYNLTDEVVLNIDMNNFISSADVSKLIGSPPGYIGYDHGGILTEHIKKYPLSIIVLLNYQDSIFEARQIIENIFRKWTITDSKHTIIDCHNTIFIFCYEKTSITVGFNRQDTKTTYDLSKNILRNIDEVIESTQEENAIFIPLKYIEQYIHKLKKHKIYCVNSITDISNINLTQKDIDEFFTSIIFENKCTTYEIKYNNNKLTFNNINVTEKNMS